MGGSSGGSQTSFPWFQQFPNAYGGMGYKQSKDFMNQAQQGLNYQSPYSQPLEQAIMHPDYAPTSEAEQNLLNTLMDQTAGRGAVRGLGAPTQASLAQTIAPQLLQAQQGYIQSLMGAKGQDIQQQGMNMQALLNLVGLAMPQVVGGNVQTGSSGGWKIL